MSFTNRYRAWCFTLNNYTLIEEDHIKNVITRLARYVIYGYEIAPDTGTPHLQGYVYFNNAKQRKAVSKLLPRAFLTPANGSVESNQIYCTKEAKGGFEFGEPPMDQDMARRKGGAGNAARYSTAIDLATQGKMDEIKESDPQLYLLHGPRLESLYKPHTVPLDGDLLHEWWVGPSGTGKSRLLWELYPNHFAKKLNKWWDGYRHEEVVAIEEWSPKNDCTASALKQWADRYPFSGEIKGSTLQKLRPKKIIVLSNYTPQQCFLNSEDLDPILRRFTVINFPTQREQARFRAADFVVSTPLEPLEDDDEELPLPDLSLDGDFFLED